MANIKLQWCTEQRKVSDLLPFKHNPRSLSDKQREDLVSSIKKFGLVEIPAINTNGKIIAGHQRIAVLQLLGRGEEKIDVRVPSRTLTAKEYKQYLLASNRIHGDWNYEILAEHFDIDTMLVSGFDDNDLSAIFADSLEVNDDDFDVEAELKKIKKPKARLGDIYALGNHRLICGDALDPDVVKRLVEKNKIDMVYCDPIYNIALDYDSGVGGKASYGGTVQDKKTDDEYCRFLKQSIENALVVTKPDAHVYFWCDQKYIGLVQGLFSESGLENKRVCLWIKGAANPVPTVAFSKCYEPCVYATRGKPYLSQVVLNLAEVFNKELGPSGNKLLDDIMDMSDIWLAKRISGQEYQHATQKPVTLHERPIKRCTKPGDTILDLFGGSGSTLMAADAMKRVCYMTEIEPVFIDLIIKRYEQSTGIKARKIN
jgi:DNA modification methylase